MLWTKLLEGPLKKVPPRKYDALPTYPMMMRMSMKTCQPLKNSLNIFCFMKLMILTLRPLKYLFAPIFA
jgi:hypothetical protein